MSPELTISISIGGVHAAARPTLIKTLLGSCIAVCLYDPMQEVGGMNHFMLPRGDPGQTDAGRFGAHAMDSLIGATMKVGGDRRRFVAKVFGGASVLDLDDSVVDVARMNIDFIGAFLEEEGIPVLSSDVGGRCPRQIRFHTGTGRAFVKRVFRVNPRLVAADRASAARPTSYGSVTLFGSD
jgi:chemotaxis receptor (MCP) glutamine deamidase CheD